MVPVSDSITIIGMPANVNVSVNDGRMGNDYPTWPTKIMIASSKTAAAFCVNVRPCFPASTKRMRSVRPSV